MTPRIRVKRDYDWRPSADDFPEAYNTTEVQNDVNDVESQTTNEVRPYEGYETSSDTGASWLSNAAIIASLTNKKLQTTLARYKSLVRLLEAEVSARAIVGRPLHNIGDPTPLPRHRNTKQHSDGDTTVRPRKKQKAKLTRSQLAALMTMLEDVIAKRETRC